jgi:DNA-binding PadR family transcriptional regulator
LSIKRQSIKRQPETSRHDALVTDFQAALLILVSRYPEVSPSEIAEWIDRGVGGLLGRSPAHMYKEIKRLAELGLLESDGPEIRMRGRGPKARYWISKQGNEAIHDWLRLTAAELPATDDSELSARVRALHVGGEEVVWAGLRNLVFQIEDRRDVLIKRERELRRADTWEGRGALDDRLEIGLARRLLGAYEDWIEDVMRELDQDDPRTPELARPSHSRSSTVKRRPNTKREGDAR